MLPLLLFVLLGLIILVLFEYRARKGKPAQLQEEQRTEECDNGGECCGQHLVCEREMPPSDIPVYYDDEELDTLAGIPAEKYTDQQVVLFREIFATLRQEDVIGWVRSLQMRDIELPPDIREEALLLVREYRAKRAVENTKTTGK